MVNIVYTDWILVLVFGVLVFLFVLCSIYPPYRLLAVFPSVAAPKTKTTVNATPTSIAAVIFVLVYCFILWNVFTFWPICLFI